MKQQKHTPDKAIVVKNVITAIQVGRDNYLLKTTNDGRGVRIENKDGSVFVPFGEAGKLIVQNLMEQVQTGSGRTRRRTKAEILSQREG